MVHAAYNDLLASVKQALTTLVTGPSQYKWLAAPERFVQQARECVGLAGTRPGEIVYDIGCGPGYLLWICRERLGCHVEGCDPLKNAPIYKELHDALRLSGSISSHASSIAQPLPETTMRYDVIFATWITWIGHDNWSDGEFAQYIEGCTTYLRPNGRLLLRFEESRFPEGSYESVLSAKAKKVAPLCYLLRRIESEKAGS